MSKFKCKICGECINRYGIGSHLNNKHNISAKEYYDKFLKRPNEGFCLECGKETNFTSLARGYKDFCSTKCSSGSQIVLQKQQETCLKRYGHKNFGQGVEAQKKSSAKKREIWNNKSDEEKQLINDKIAETKSHWSKDFIEEISKKETASVKKYWDNLSDDEMARVSSQHSKIVKEYWDNLSEEEKIVRIEKSLGKQKNFSEEKKKQIHKKISVTRLNFTQEKNRELALKRAKSRPSGFDSLAEFRTNNVLISLFGKDDVVYQYIDERYPYPCDFYIKSLDLFIECHYYWTHGDHFFDENNQDDVKILEFWKSKGKPQYESAIYCWTVTDIKKKNCAIRNNLNYIALFSEKDFDCYIEKLKKELTIQKK